MKLKYKITLIFILFLLLFIINNNYKIYAADVSLFTSWVETNKKTFQSMTDGFEYIIVNNVSGDYVCMYYAVKDDDKSFKIVPESSTSSNAVVLFSSNYDIDDINNYYYGKTYFNYYTENTDTFAFASTSLSPLTYDDAVYVKRYERIIRSINENDVSSRVLYSSSNFYYEDMLINANPIYFNDFELTSINFTENKLLEPLTLETNMFNFENVSNYRLYVSYNNVSNFVESGQIATHTDVQNNKTYFYFTYLADKNGTYYFRLYNRNSGEWSNTISFDVQGVDINSTISSNIEVPNFYIEKRDNSFVLQTQWLDINKRDFLHLFYSEGNKIFYDCEGFNLSTVTYTDSNGITYFRYEYIVYEEGTYYFKFVDINENTSSLDVQIDLRFDIDYSDTLIAQPNYDFVPSLEYELSFEEFDKVIIYSQWFDIQYLNSYKLYLHNNINGFVDSYSEIEENGTKFRFKYTATENRVYHFRIYYITDILSLYSSTVSINVTLIGSQSYMDFVLNKLFGLYEKSFGFLTYPFTLFFDICNRFMNIEFSEPIINIPDIYVPLYENSSPLISATSINFNEIIENNSTFKTIHNLILICTDAFIVFGLVTLLKKKWGEVFR